MVESLNIVNQIIADKLNPNLTNQISSKLSAYNSSNSTSLMANMVNSNTTQETKIIKYLVREKKNLKSFDFLKMTSILIHFKK